jgi:hypothetical protein
MICEPVVLVEDVSGDLHFDAKLPLKTVIDVHNLLGHWARTVRGTVVMELDERKVIYERIGLTPEGHWVCRLKVDPKADDAQS